MAVLDALIEVVDELVSAISSEPDTGPPLASYAGGDLTKHAIRIILDARFGDTARQAKLRSTYGSEYGLPFTVDADGSPYGIWYPWTSFETDGAYFGRDLGLVLQVAQTLNVDPVRVAALWIIEGKAVFGPALHGKAVAIAGGVPVTRAVTPEQVRSWLRSTVFYYCFGSDKFGAIRVHASGDNEALGPSADHDAAFAAAWQLLDVSQPPFQGRDEVQVAKWLGHGGVIPDPALPTPGRSGKYGHGFPLKIRLSDDGVSSMLFLQAALFSAYERYLQGKFDADYGAGAVDVRTMPWATYLGWNSKGDQGETSAFAGIDRQYAMHFAPDTGQSAQDRLAAMFGIGGVLDAGHQPPDDQVPARAPTDPPSAWENAVRMKYVCESVSTWFAVA